MNDAAERPDVVTRESCRVCGSVALTSVMKLGDQCIAGFFPQAGADRLWEQKYPLELVWCDQSLNPAGCGLLQLRDSLRSDLLYDSYWYRSGINQTMTSNLHEIAHAASDLVGGLQPGDLAIDIGCNDGTLLDGYQHPDGVRLLGIDPSDVTRYALAKGYEVAKTYFSAAAVREHCPDQPAKIITSIAMFYDLEDPNAFVADIARVLAPGGVWVSEFSYMPTMLEMNSFDTICHEHLEYYSLAVIERLLAGAGLQVLQVELNTVNGGSIRLFAGHGDGPSPGPEHRSRLSELRSREMALGLTTAEPYRAFDERSQAVRDALRTLLEELKGNGKVIHVYGASTKGNTTLQYAEIDHTLIDCAADRNPDKWGSETIGTRIPIVSEEESRRRRPDFYLVMPWHFLDEMIERERSFFRSGGHFIVPLPHVRILDDSGAITG